MYIAIPKVLNYRIFSFATASPKKSSYGIPCHASLGILDLDLVEYRLDLDLPCCFNTRRVRKQVNLKLAENWRAR